MIISVLVGCLAVAKVFSMVSRSLNGCQCVLGGCLGVSKRLLRHSEWFERNYMIISVLVGCSAVAKVFSMVSRSLSDCQCVLGGC